MLIRLRTALGDMGVEHGVLRSSQVAQVLTLDDARHEQNLQAEEILEQARLQADEIIAAAHAHASSLLDDAQIRINDACDQGYADGEARAAEEWHERQVALSMRNSHTVRGLHEKLAEVVTMAVERIVQTEGRAALFQRALKSVQSLSRQATALTLRVGSADFDAARDGIGSIAYLQEAGLTVEVTVDPTLPPGSCVFESDLGVVDASLHTQLNALRAAMERAVKRAVAEEEPAQPVDALSNRTEGMA